MLERLKTIVLIILVALSLVQTYLLAYRMPELAETTKSDQEYVNTELLGDVLAIEDVVFPNELILHMGNDEHTLLYPNTQFYDIIVRQRLASREFNGFQKVMNPSGDWDAIRRQEVGIELSFGEGVSMELIQKLFKIDAGSIEGNKKITKILIYKVEELEDVKTYFFDSDGYSVYEAIRADLTVKDVQDYVAFGTHLPRYELTSYGYYLAKDAIQAAEMTYKFDVITAEQMQRSLFFDFSLTRTIVNRNGAQIYTDGKRGLTVEQNGLWINYTNSAASQSSQSPLMQDVYISLEFVNQHGGWDKTYQFVGLNAEDDMRYVRFRQYIEQYPVIHVEPEHYGYILLGLQQGVVTEYNRSLIALLPTAKTKATRWLNAGDALQSIIQQYPYKKSIASVFPALKAVAKDNKEISFVPVWAVRLFDGTEDVLAEALPKGSTPLKKNVDPENEEIEEQVDNQTDNQRDVETDKQSSDQTET